MQGITYTVYVFVFLEWQVIVLCSGTPFAGELLLISCHNRVNAITHQKKVL